MTMGTRGTPVSKSTSKSSVNEAGWGMEKNDIEFLKVFYDVETDAELIGAMNRHIEKLQAKLTRFSPPEPAVTKLREG